MITFKTPRNASDLYSKNHFSSICDRLGVSDPKQQEMFKELIERGSQDFLKRQKDNSKKLTPTQETKAFKKLAQHLNKSKKAYAEIAEVSHMSVFRFFKGLSETETKHMEEKSFILDSATDNKIFLKPNVIKNILEILEEAAIEASNQSPIFLKKNKTNLVLQWIWYFSDEWEEISDIKISEGRYDEKELKYVSPAMQILDELAKPLGITNSQIAEAIKVYREKKKTEIPFDPEDYFQGNL